MKKGTLLRLKGLSFEICHIIATAHKDGMFTVRNWFTNKYVGRFTEDEILKRYDIVVIN